MEELCRKLCARANTSDYSSLHRGHSLILSETDCTSATLQSHETPDFTCFNGVVRKDNQNISNSANYMNSLSNHIHCRNIKNLPCVNFFIVSIKIVVVIVGSPG